MRKTQKTTTDAKQPLPFVSALVFFAFSLLRATTTKSFAALAVASTLGAFYLYNTLAEVISRVRNQHVLTRSVLGQRGRENRWFVELFDTVFTNLAPLSLRTVRQLWGVEPETWERTLPLFKQQGIVS
jgi:hypothetical protein